MQSTNRQPRNWSSGEDQTLRREVEMQLQNGGEIKDWCKIAKALPGRTNKDCRKRWHNSVAGGLKKGQWSKSEDALLTTAVERFGQKWTLVATRVDSRSADQCAKRWQQALDPELDRSEWREDEDEILLEATQRLGRHWKDIQRAHFPSRSKNCIKNRYTVLVRRYQNRGLLISNGASSPSEPGSPQELESQLLHENTTQSTIGIDSVPIPHTFTTTPQQPEYWHSSDARAYSEWSPDVLSAQFPPQLTGQASAENHISQIAYYPQDYGAPATAASSMQMSWGNSEPASPFSITTHTPHPSTIVLQSPLTYSSYTIAQSSSSQNIPASPSDLAYSRSSSAAMFGTHESSIWQPQSSHNAGGSVWTYVDPRRQRREHQQHPQ